MNRAGLRHATTIGSGPNGLAAIELARANVSVRVLEAAKTIGSGMRTEEATLPGFLHDICSAFHRSFFAWCRSPNTVWNGFIRRRSSRIRAGRRRTPEKPYVLVVQQSLFDAHARFDEKNRR